LTSVQLGALSSAQLSAFETRDLVVLTTSAIRGVSSASIAGLTTAQVEALTTLQSSVLSSAQLRALDIAQLSAFETRDLAALTTSAIRGISSASITGLTTAQVVALTTSQAAALTSIQLGMLSSSQLAAMETRDLFALTTDAIRAMSTSGIQGLTTSQALALSSAQSAVLNSVQLGAFETQDLAALTTSAIRGISSAGIRGLTTNQIAALTTLQSSVLTSVQLGALSSAQLSAFETRDLVVLTTSAIRGISSASIAGLTTAQVASLSTSQIKALTPLVLDLHEDGINTTSLANGTVFDLGNTGTPVRTGWVARGDGLLVRDINSDSVINDGGELFGEGTVLPSGHKAQDGYEALTALDTNRDGAIDANDATFKELAVWIDNGDGVTQVGELKSLTELGITSLSLAATQSTIVDNGNLIGLMGSYTTADGKTHTMGDVWFQIDPSGQRVFDLATALLTHRASVAEGKVELNPNQGHERLTVTLDDVLHLGQTDVMGQVALMIDGSGPHTVDLSSSGQWSGSGQIMIEGQHYAVYVDPIYQARLLVNDKLNVVL
jgi:hypothetical protein